MPTRLAFVLQLILSTNAFAQEAPVTDCDKYAASEFDPQRKATGVPFDEVNAALAVPACESAVRHRQSPFGGIGVEGLRAEQSVQDRHSSDCS